jgi:hypothetical protein
MSGRERRLATIVAEPQRGDPRTDQPDTVVVRLPSFAARVTSNSPQILRDLASLYPGAATEAYRSAAASGPPFAVVEYHRQAHGHLYELSAQGEEPCSFVAARHVVAHLEYLINAAAAVRLRRRLLLHAGAVASTSGAVVFPGESGSGKSTLVAALCLAGFDYLSDELAVVDCGSLAVLPFLKPICLKDGGWRALAASFDLPPTLRAIRADGEAVCYLPPPQPCSPDQRLPIGYILMPVRRRGAAASLTPASRATTLAELARHSLNLPQHGRVGVEVLARIVEGAECYTLSYDDPLGAVAAVAALLRRRRTAHR